MKTAKQMSCLSAALLTGLALLAVSQAATAQKTQAVEPTSFPTSRTGGGQAEGKLLVSSKVTEKPNTVAALAAARVPVKIFGVPIDFSSTQISLGVQKTLNKYGKVIATSQRRIVRVKQSGLTIFSSVSRMSSGSLKLPIFEHSVARKASLMVGPIPVSTSIRINGRFGNDTQHFSDPQPDFPKIAMRVNLAVQLRGSARTTCGGIKGATAAVQGMLGLVDHTARWNFNTSSSGRQVGTIAVAGKALNSSLSVLASSGRSYTRLLGATQNLASRTVLRLK